MKQEDDIRVIVERVSLGDKQAFREIITQYKGLGFTIALRMVRNREDAEEVVQDAFVKAFKSIKQFRGEGQFSAWFYRIVYRTAMTRLRKKKIGLDSLSDEESEITADLHESESASKNIKSQERSFYIKKALEALSASDSLIITLFYISENSLPEICQITGWTMTNAKTRLHRARKRLYQKLEILLPGELEDLL